MEPLFFRIKPALVREDKGVGLETSKTLDLTTQQIFVDNVWCWCLESPVVLSIIQVSLSLLKGKTELFCKIGEK